MSKKMMVNATHPEENRVAIVEDGILTELDIEVAGREPSKGNIYKAVVVRVETGLQAAFVDYGADRLGFLQIDEINYTTVKPDYTPAEDGRRPRINDLLSRGQEILVQITKEERGTKGAALTTYLSLAGRYMVLMPGSQTRGVSRKAESDAQRKELKKAMSSLDLAEGIGYIVRTAALDQTREELERDYRYLIRLFESIKELEQKAKAPALIYKESNLMIRSIRDYFTTEMDEVLIDDPQVFKEAKDFFQMVMPDHIKLVKLHQERRPIFSRYQIEDQIETLSRNKVLLPSGGSIVIDPTEALVAIDVNSGKMASERGVEDTATKTNLEAATEVGRQLRLRDLGGLIVIDFIDMRDRKNNRAVENQVKKSLENDKARVSVGRISKFGLLEMSRQRIKAALTEGSYLPCPHCNGSGHLKSPETQAVALLRKIHASAAKGQVSRVDAQLPIEVAAYLLNNNREELVEMERRYQLQIHIHGNRDFLSDQVEIEIQKKEKSKSTQQEFVEAGSVPLATEEESKRDKEETDLPAVEETAEVGTDQPKKRRRRRRRKPSGATASEAEQNTSDTDEPTSEDAATDSTDTITGAAEEKSDDVAPAKKPQRPRRSRSKKVTESAATTEAPAQEAPVAETPEEKPAEAAEGNQDAQEAKPKRRRSRRKPKSAADEVKVEPPSTTDKNQSATSDTTTEPPAEVAAGEKPEVETKPKPRRPRRTTKKTDPPTEATKVAPEAPAEESAQKEAASEKKVETKKPASRRPRLAKAKVTKTEAAAEKSEEKSAPAESGEVVKKAPAKRPRKKPAAKEIASVEKSEPIVTEIKENTVGEKPKPKTRRTSTAKPKAKDADALKATEEANSAEKKTVQKAPAKTKAPAKKTTRKTAVKDEVAAKPTEEPAKAKRTRTPRKKAVEKDSGKED
ncbi:Rne/Rng family ribonuclease [Deltaproteobacteria bacterium IMCC39524]|nr:Rne/Rng family ribonuclease [Deltaproteobacteria bacterium IMCC39524]